MFFLWVPAALLVFVIGALCQFNYYDTASYRDLCHCFHTWRSLDVRWAHLCAATHQIVAEPNRFTVSVVFAAAGSLFAWFVGRLHIRVPLDEWYFDHISANCATYGCIQGQQALVPIHRRTAAPTAEGSVEPLGQTLPLELWCPTRARVAAQVCYLTPAHVPNGTLAPVRDSAPSSGSVQDPLHNRTGSGAPSGTEKDD